MNKGIAATLLVALILGTMIWLLTYRMCQLFPSELYPYAGGCWIVEKSLAYEDGRYTARALMPSVLASSVSEHHIVATQAECEVAVEAVRALGNDSEDTVIPTLHRIALDASCLSVRKAAVNQLGHIGTPGAQEALAEIARHLTPGLIND